MFTVYLIVNKLNGKMYVGKTERSLRGRWLEHLSFARCGAAWLLSRAFRKYGPENFELSVIATTDSIEELNRLEILWIFLLWSHGPCGYNMTDGGDGVSGRKLSEEAKKRISIANTGKTHTPETRERLRLAHTGRKLPESQKAKISASNKGKVNSPEARAKLRLANLGKSMPESARKKISAANKLKSGPTASRFNHNLSTDEIKNLKDSGLTIRQIAERLHIDKSTVSDRLRKAGEILPTSKATIRIQRLREEGKEHLVAPNNKIIARQYRGGTTVKQLAEQYELAPVSIRNRLKTQGITFEKKAL